MRINHNISSMVTEGSLFRVNRSMSKSLERLSTGLRINRSSDDAAGLSVSENLRTQVNGLAMAKRNAQDGTALLQIAEGAGNEISNMLQRMRELAVQSSNDTLTSTERNYLNVEFRALQDEIDRIANSTKYNSMCLISGNGFGSGGGSVLHVGPNSSTSVDRMTITVDAISTAAMCVSSGTQALNNCRITTNSFAVAAISSIDSAINSVNNMRADLGSYVNRLDYAIDNLDNVRTNTQAAESVIRDVDFAAESTAFTNSQILSQSAIAMLAQSNAIPQNVLMLLR